MMNKKMIEESNKPATEKQMETLMGFAIPFPKGVSKLEAEFLIKENGDRLL